MKNMDANYLTLDLETHLIEQDNLVPRIVSSAYKLGNQPEILLETRESPLKSFNLYSVIEEHLSKGREYKLIGQNIPFDLACLVNEKPEFLPVIFKAFEQGQVHDTMVIGKLKAIREGTLGIQRFSLKDLAKRELGITVEGKTGEDAWRFRYSELDGIPLEQWPQEAIDYAKEDVRITEEVYLELRKDSEEFKEIEKQTRVAWVLHLIGVYGMKVNPSKAKKWTSEVEEEVLKGIQLAEELGILRENGSRNIIRLRELVSTAYEGNPPLTDKDKVRTDRETLKNSEDPKLVAYAKSASSDKLLNTYAPILKKGETVHPRYNVLVKSGRTSCSKPNMQNPPRGGGFRELFEPREGFVFALCDYDQIELLGLAQVHLWLFGKSSIANAVNEGRDLHMEVAKTLNPNDPKSYRQFSKVANYGFPGGLSAKVFSIYAKGYGLDVSEEAAQEIRKAWLETWPEMDQYFKWISKKTSWGSTECLQFVSKRVRGDCTFTQYCNSLFQGLVADGAKDALFEVSKACFIDLESPLWGSRPVAFLHDEIILECPEEKASDAARELSKVMIKEMEKYIPDIKIGAEVILSRVWSKKAKKIEKGGQLLPWEKE